MNSITKLSLACGMLLAGSMTPIAAEGLLAFPGAEGWGRYATGGRGGEIYHVTNLNDSGTGSLRDAVSKGGRIVVFDVSGVIHLQSRLVFSGNSTILGQTAPGEGIQVYGDGVSFSGASNLIVRHMRFRMGVNGTSGKDAAGIANGHTMIFDHLSVLWGQDECFSINPDGKGTEPYGITIQNSIIGQGLQTHSCGGLMQTNGGVTLYRNLYIENKTRNPKVKGIMQFVNNVSYNWGNAAAYNMSGDSEGTSWAEITDNFWVRGPWKNAARPLTGGNERQHYYGEGNYYDYNIDGKRDDNPFTEENYTQSGGNRASTIDEINTGIAAQTTGTEKSLPEIKGRMTAPNALTWVLANAGASLPVRDEVDQYLIDELSSFGSLGSSNGISTEKILPHKGTGTLHGGTKPLDSDGDGIPDDWEIDNGLNPNDASDAAKIAENGYANIENYVFTIDEPYPYVKSPTNLKSSKVEKDAITISWTDNSDNETGFVIEMSTDNKTFSKVGDAKANATSFKAENLAENTVHYFRVYATGENGIQSSTSPVLKSLTIDEPFKPNATTLLTPANGTSMKILDASFSWKNTTEDYFGDITYAFYMGTDKENLEKIIDGMTETSFNPGNFEVDKTYYWRVDATNDIGTTESAVWSFTIRDGGTLFYADFKTSPKEWADSEWGAIAAVGGEADLFGDTSAHSGEFEFGDLVIGTTSGRIHLFGNRSPSANTTDDEGGSKSAIGFVGKAGDPSKGYFKVKNVEGPWSITIYAYNSDGASMTYQLSTATDNNGVEENKETLATFSMAAAKKAFKHTYTYTKNDGPKTIIIGNTNRTDKGWELFDIIIEKFVASDVEPLELTSGSLDNNISYADGSYSLTFNQNILYDGKATLTGQHDHENVKVSAAGKQLTLTYTGLDINSTYTLCIPEGSVTTVDGAQSFSGDIKFTTCDFPAAKKSGETHWGKATTLPLNFTPFNSYASVPTASGTAQAKAADYPHWVTASGSTTAEYAQLTKTSDKVMTYFDSEAAQAYVELSVASGTTCSVKLQETRNADIAPAWRTMRVLTQADMPFKGYIDLNPETRMLKILPESLSGSLYVNSLRVSDKDGYFGADFDGVDEIIGNDCDAEYYNLQGIRVAGDPAPGIYICRKGNETFKVLIK